MISANTVETSATPTRFIRLRELLTRVPLSRTRIYELVDEGRFPRPIKLSDRAIAWDSAIIEQWLAERRKAAA